MIRPLVLLVLAASGWAAQAQSPTDGAAGDEGQAARVLVAEAYDVLLDGTAFGFSFTVTTTTPDTTLTDTGGAITALDPETTGSRFQVTFGEGEVQLATLTDDTYSVAMPRTRTVYVDSTRSEMSSGPVGLLMLHPAFGAALYSIASDARAEMVGPDTVAGAACTRARYVLTLDEIGNELALDVCFDDELGLPSEILYRDSGGVEAQMRFAEVEALGAAAEFQPEPLAPDGWRLAPYDHGDLPLLEVGQAAPGFTLQDATGAPVSLSDFHGRRVLVDFWGTWCAPCVQAIPHLQEIADAYPDLVILGLASYEDPDADPAGFVRQRGGRYPVLRADEATVEAWRAHAFPTYVVVDSEGTVAFVAVEDRDPDAWVALNAFLASVYAD